jgi:ASC-1-like (ASCH) protein
MKCHNLKIKPQYFKAVVDGSKKFEIRENDRDYQVGDCIFLNEFDGQNYTGESLPVIITYMLKGGEYGLKEGYVILSIEEINKDITIK